MKLIISVDDDPRFLEYLNFAVRAAGHEILSFQDSEQALQHLRNAKNARPDLILLDAEMPGLDGRSFWMQLQRDQTLRKIPIVMITGARALKSEFENVMKVAAFLTKPVDIKLLRQTLNKILGSSV